MAGRTTESWSGRAAFILASIGAAVGLGNIWKFPYTLGNSGGSAFVLIYVLAMLLIATPIMLSEMVIGRHARMSAPSAMRKVALESGASGWWQAVGWMGQLVQLLVLSFYSVIAGWTMAYLFKSIGGGLHGLSPAEIGADFDAFLHDPSWMILWHFVFTALTVFVVSRGVRIGLERVVRVLMPGLFAMLVGLVIYAAINFEFGAATKYLFSADLSKITPGVVLAAVGQAFFSVNVGHAHCATGGTGDLPDRLHLWPGSLGRSGPDIRDVVDSVRSHARRQHHQRGFLPDAAVRRPDIVDIDAGNHDGTRQ